MAAERLGDIPLEDLNAEQMVRLLDIWATYLDETDAPQSLVQAMDLLSDGIQGDRIGQAEATAALRAFLDKLSFLADL